jgi:hypothetical protein
MDHQLVDLANPATAITAILAAIVARVAIVAPPADRSDAGNADVFAGAAILVLRGLLRRAGNLADRDQFATAARAAVATAIVAAVAAEVASSFWAAGGFTPECESLPNQRARADEGKSDQSKEISFHVYCLLFNALVS